MNDPADREETERLLRELAPQVIGVLVRRYRDFAAAEDAVQEALLAAATTWPREGRPDHPRGWLIQVASRRLIDQIRSESARRQRENDTLAVRDFVVPEPVTPAEPEALDPADTLVLLFMCCHSALTTSSAIALTLRAVGGLTTAEIARAFLVPESTMAQRISRAKQTIRAAGAAFQMPDAAERRTRLDAVLHVLYLIFNEGYTASSGHALLRTDLSDEAIRLTRSVHALLPDEPEVAGLLALLLLTDARRAARTDTEGRLVALDAQDRSRWNRVMIAEGVTLLTDALARGRVGPYQLQAAVAAVHDEATHADDTDWPQIRAIYTLLKRMADNPLIDLNIAIATAMIDGPEAGLTAIALLESDERLAGGHRLDAVRAHLFAMTGDRDAAIAAYRRAAARTTSVPERDYLIARAAALEDRPLT